MVDKFKTHALGKLEIYLEPAHKVRHGDRTLFRKMFPRSAYLHIIKEAKKDGIMKASAFHTHTSYIPLADIPEPGDDRDGSRPTMCISLVDQKQRLQHFVHKHNALLQNKIVIYKEVEFWDIG